MEVSIKFFGMQRVTTKTDSINVPIDNDTSVKDVLGYVSNRFPDLNLDEGTIFITVNQKKAATDRILSADDIVSFLPYVSGG
jgi:molybdopterin converting factor small subunit